MGLIKFIRRLAVVYVSRIFVHGLFGHPRKTWSARVPRPTFPSVSRDSSPPQAGKQGSIFWPSALLPTVIPDASVFTWGYDADVDGFLASASQNTIHQHATNLLSDLADFRDPLANKSIPIIFVAHSLGGIVVKDALNQSSHSENVRLKEIAPATFGVCFLGTPHQGSKSASIGKIAYQATVAVTRRPNVRLLHALERNSDTLDSIAESFSQTLLKGGMQISSFREEMETRKLLIFSMIVVDSNSAKIGDRREEVGSIPANHRNMTKFSFATEVGFKRVSAQLRRWVGRIKSVEDDFTLQDRCDCLASLNNENTRIRIWDVAKSHDRTFHWLFDRDVVQFHEWLESNALEMSRIFWIQGKPGSGKSTLMKHAMHEKRTIEILASDNSQWTLVGFFFHDRGSGVQKSLSGMLQEILYQILVQLEGLIPFVLPYYAKLVRDQQTKFPIWDVRTLRLALVATMEQREIHIRICIFLDALDEHDGDNDQLASLLYELISNADNDKVRIKVCLASRSWNVFEFHFGQSPGFAIHDYTQSDIQEYTLSRIGDSLGLARLEVSPKRLESIAGQITSKASGVFIWVKLVVDELVRGIRDGTPLSVLEEDISKMPQELKDLYLRTLSRIEPAYVEECYVMLQIALCNLSALPLEAFIKCTSYTLRGKIAQLETTSHQAMARRLKSRSGGLLEIVSTAPLSQAPAATKTAEVGDPVQVVQFIHQTVKEFVQDCKNDLGLCWKDNAAALSESGYLYLLRCSIEINDKWVDDIGSDLFEYASLAEKELPEGSTKVCDAVFSLKARERWDKVMWLIDQEKYKYATYLGHLQTGATTTKEATVREAGLPRIVSWLAVMAGLNSCARRLCEGQVFNPGEQSLLLVAALGPRIVLSQDRVGMVNSLLDAGHPVDFQTSPIPCVADPAAGNPPIGECTVLTLLLAGKGYYPMTEETRLSVAGVLLERGADLNALLPEAKHPGSPGARSNCLHHCARFESEDMVRLFLQHGANPSVPDIYFGLTPRMYATLRKHLDIIQVLSECETDQGNKAKGSDLNTYACLAISGCVLAANVGHGKVIGEVPRHFRSSRNGSHGGSSATYTTTSYATSRSHVSSGRRR